MSDARERLRVLVARALGTDSIEEARTTALLALKHARDKKLAIDFREVLEEEPSIRRAAENPPSPAGVRPPPSPSKGKRGPSPRPGGPPPPKQPSYRRRNPDAHGAQYGPTQPVMRRARDSGTCDSCRRGFPPGAVVGSYPGGSETYHAECLTAGRARF